MSVLIRELAGGRYLERVPYDGTFAWLATIHRHATPLTGDVAAAFARFFRAHGVECGIVGDQLHRAPEIQELPEFVAEWERVQREAAVEIALEQAMDRR